ncbi:transketolase family protein [Planctomicrobium sp. SH664]|uniref:transketolase family protein n=1 Tax=Planctomicrobium sp. SH664 TaxID=3448125 RepID=UPI003F5C4E23
MYLGEYSGLKLGPATRDAFGDALKEVGSKNQAIVTVDADVGNSTRTEPFSLAHPDRTFNVGIAESNMVSVAGGLAACGKIPVVSSFACFLMDNAFDQIRMSIAFPHLNVKLVGSHAGISIGEDGPSQMGIEDVALACSLPGVVVIVPSDAACTKAATEAMFEHEGPAYLRIGRGKVATLYKDGIDFKLGKAIQLQDGTDATIIANGLMVGGALDAAKKLGEQGLKIRVLDMHTVKPLDVEAIAKAAKETGAIVVAEEHLRHGGLGSVVAQAVCETTPVPMEYVDVGDQYAESGDPQGLLDKYGLTADAITAAVKKAIGRKTK